ncbi:hypothetical protein Nepgr_014516 [Nepenthes gracilis]|uniref:Uncharacterized protein n=1 Tax=Nepenthes gracilis TaxID=150966 RepID=A0AAD3XQJ8_NEPGR|nr:hypothetical protein Nepgr_014516 [Nepenthes gracilis]
MSDSKANASVKEKVQVLERSRKWATQSGRERTVVQSAGKIRKLEFVESKKTTEMESVSQIWIDYFEFKITGALGGDF